MDSSLNAIVKFEPKILFYKAWYYKEWAERCKNIKVKRRLIKKALKEILNTDKDKLKENIKIELNKSFS